MQYLFVVAEAGIGLIWQDTKVNPGWSSSDKSLFKTYFLYI